MKNQLQTTQQKTSNFGDIAQNSIKKTITTLMLAIICTSNLLNAQAPNYQWAKSIDQSAGLACATDAGGNVIVIGTYISTITIGTTVLTNAGGEDIFIAKYDANGNVLWAKSAGGTGFDRGNSCSTDANGDLIVTGMYDSPSITFGTTTLTNAGSQDIFITKYDTNGNVLWAKSAGGTGYDLGNSCSTDASGNIIVTGYFISPSITFGTTVLNTAGSQDIFITKYDANGNVLWAKRAGGGDSDVGFSCSTDASGNVIIAGYFNSTSITFGTTVLTNANPGFEDIFIAKYNANGNVLWAKRAGGSGSDVGFCCSTDASGNVIIAGSFDSPSITFGTTVINTVGGSDIFIAKYDANGNVLWVKSAGGSADDIWPICTTDASGNVILTAAFSSPSITIGTTVLYNVGLQDIVIAKYDANGNVLWAEQAGGSYDDVSPGCVTDANGNIFVSGYFLSSSITFGATVLTNTSVVATFIVKLNSITGLEEFEEVGGFTIAPNPISFQATITFQEEQKNSCIKIIDLLGKEIKKVNFSGSQLVLDKAEMPAGIYFVQLTDEKNHFFNRKIVMQ